MIKGILKKKKPKYAIQNICLSVLTVYCFNLFKFKTIPFLNVYVDVFIV